MIRQIAFLALYATTPVQVLATRVPAEPIAQKGDVILADAFERSDLGAWKPLFGTFRRRKRRA